MKPDKLYGAKYNTKQVVYLRLRNLSYIIAYKLRWVLFLFNLCKKVEPIILRFFIQIKQMTVRLKKQQGNKKGREKKEKIHQ